MNYIGIDISINSTAVYIESGLGQFIISVTNKKSNNKWVKDLSCYGVKFIHHDRQVSENYSENEILKIRQYMTLSEIIVLEIMEKIMPLEDTYCNIEGYSFSKNTKSILDIVSYSTLIRSELIRKIPSAKISVVSPMSLKLETCKLVYPAQDVGKKKPKLEWKNYEGIPGGLFKKPEMFKSIIEGRIDCPILPFLDLNKDLLLRDKIPNPIEDIIDAILAAKTIKKVEM